MKRENRLDIDGRYVLATADDHVVDATRHIEIAVRVQIARVAREVPALSDRLCVGVGTLPVAFKGFVARQFGDDLPFLACARERIGTRCIETDDPQARIDACASRTARLSRGV